MPEQQTNPIQETTEGVLHELWHTVTDFNEKFYRTLSHLFIRPDEVGRSYISGDKRTYYNPYQFLLALTAIVLAISHLSLDEAMWHEFIDATFQEQINRTPLQEGNEAQQAVMKKMEKFFRYYGEAIIIMSTRYNSLLHLILHVPLISWVNWLMFRKRLRYFRSHYVYNTYLMAILGMVSTLIMTVTVPIWMNGSNMTDFRWISLISVMFHFPYFLWAWSKFLGLNHLGQYVKLLGAYILGLLLASVGIAIVAISYALIRMFLW